jgi:hypothetical protein
MRPAKKAATAMTATVNAACERDIRASVTDLGEHAMRGT